MAQAAENPPPLAENQIRDSKEELGGPAHDWGVAAVIGRRPAHIHFDAESARWLAGPAARHSDLMRIRDARVAAVLAAAAAGVLVADAKAARYELDADASRRPARRVGPGPP